MSSSLPLRLGDYRLCKEIGAGGMATVYLARVKRGGSSRFVAVKRLHAHLVQNPAFVEMFFDEVSIASQIHHANVCTVIDFAADAEGHFLAMEYLLGEPLSNARLAIADRSIRPPPLRHAALVARIVADACEGLHATHELCDVSGQPLNVVHRDVSPENIFITFDGTTKIVDFGVACAARQKHHTAAGVVKGKVSYMAPEVLRGLRPDRRADIWSLGVVFWELLTLQRLFRRDTDVDTVRAVLKAPIAPPSRVCQGIPPELDRIALRALARKPGSRYATARELGRDLSRALVQLGQSVGAAEISEWMNELFPGGRAGKQELLRTAVHEDEAFERSESVEHGVGDARTRIAPRRSRDGTVELRTGDLRYDRVRIPFVGPAVRGVLVGLFLLFTGGLALSYWTHARPREPTRLSVVSAGDIATGANACYEAQRSEGVHPERYIVELRSADAVTGRQVLVLDVAPAVQ